MVLMATAAASSSVVFIVATHLHDIDCCYSALSSAISSRQKVTLHNHTEHERHGAPLPFCSFSSYSKSSISPPCLPVLLPPFCLFSSSSPSFITIFSISVSFQPPPHTPLCSVSITSEFKNSIRTCLSYKT